MGIMNKKILLPLLCAAYLFSGCKKDDRWSSVVPIGSEEQYHNPTVTVGEQTNTNSENIAIEYNYSYEKPVFKQESGFYDEDIWLEISVSDKNYQIRYTTDGSLPDINSPVYKQPLKIQNRTSEPNVLSAIKETAPAGDQYTPSQNVDKCTVVRAAVFDQNGVSGPVVTNTYFIGFDQYRDYNGLPIVSIVTDKENLFDYEKGIYMLGKYHDEWKSKVNINSYQEWSYEANYTQRGRDWERVVNFELIETDGKMGYEGELGLRIMGNATRAYNQKSFRLYAREEYGDKNIKYPLIPEATKEKNGQDTLKKYRTFLLRNGGNDCNYSKIRDPLVQKLVADRNMDTQESRATIVFINGEYWGVYSLEEDYSDNYIQNNYDIDNKDAIIIKCGELEEGENADMALYNELKSVLDSDLSIDQNYQKLCSMVDIQNFADYFTALIYTANEDCIFNNNNNWRLWRSRSVTDVAYQDGKWRYMLYDTEFSLGLYRGTGYGQIDSLSTAMNGKVFKKLIKNEDFKALFVTTFMDMRNYNFNMENVTRVIDKLDSQYGPAIYDTVKRFGPSWVASSDPKGRYDKDVNSIRDFLSTRYTYTPEMVRKSMNLSPAVDVTINVNDKAGGKVQINTICPDMSSGSFTGKYFTEYPITLSAECEEGYVFQGWTGSITSDAPVIDVTFEDAVDITAVFVKK